jgi:hypothetical protein
LTLLVEIFFRQVEWARIDVPKAFSHGFPANLFKVLTLCQLWKLTDYFPSGCNVKLFSGHGA